MAHRGNYVVGIFSIEDTMFGESDESIENETEGNFWFVGYF